VPEFRSWVDDGLVLALSRSAAAQAPVRGPRHPLDHSGFTCGRRYCGNQTFVSAGRALLDHVVRQRTLAGGRVEYVKGTEVIGLIGGADRVTGALVRNGGTRLERTLAENLGFTWTVAAGGSRTC
jgi:hypothetical protein